MRSSAVSPILLLAASLFVVAPRAAAWTEITSSGDPVPGGPEGVLLRGAWPIAITDDGTVLLWGMYDGGGPQPTPPRGTGLWSWTPSRGLVPFASAWVHSPYTPAPPDGAPARATRNGWIVVRDDTRLLSCRAGEADCVVVAEVGGTLADPPDAVIQSIDDFGVDEMGTIAFLATIQRPAAAETSALFSAASGDTPTLLAESGEPLPDVAGELLEAPFSELRRCGDGWTFIDALVSFVDAGPPSRPRHLLRWTPAYGLSSPFAAGTPTPGMPEGWEFQSLALFVRPNEFTSPCNASGSIAFPASSIDSSGQNLRIGLWSCPVRGGCTLRALGGDPAPGGNGGFILTDFPTFGTAAVADDDTVFFLASTWESASVYGSGLFASDANGAVTAIARDGDAVPGTVGTRFLGFQIFGERAGRLAFVATQESPTDGPGSGLYWTDGAGPIETLVTAPGPSGTFAPYSDYDLEASDASLERAVMVAVSGNILTGYHETLFYTTVPEPTAAARAMVALAALALALYARRR